jgi:hypothetical protein
MQMRAQPHHRNKRGKNIGHPKRALCHLIQFLCLLAWCLCTFYFSGCAFLRRGAAQRLFASATVHKLQSREAVRVASLREIHYFMRTPRPPFALKFQTPQLK